MVEASDDSSDFDDALPEHRDAESGKPSVIQLITYYRQSCERFIAKHSYANAARVAEQALNISREPCDVFRVANAYFCEGNYHRAIQFLHTHEVLFISRTCRYLCAKAHVANKEWSEALNVLGEENNDIENEEDFGLENLRSSLWLLRGTIYEAKEKRSMAIKCYKESLHADIHNLEAFHKLTTNHMLSQQEERELVESLPWHTVPAIEKAALTLQYNSMCKKYGPVYPIQFPEQLESMSENLDLKVGYAFSLYINLKFRAAFEITSSVLDHDPFHEKCLLLHIGCLVELKKLNDLFIKAHQLVNNYPNKSLTWYSVGCYYYLKNNQEHARRYFSKATELDLNVGESLLAFGHSFSADGEHDQAMIAYCSAARLVSGSHLPQLFIGMEYVVQQDYELAFTNFEVARNMCPADPLVIHEIGVANFRSGKYKESIKNFKESLSLADKPNENEVSSCEFIHTVLTNLGHSYRKLGMYTDALYSYQKSIEFSPVNPATFSALGFTYHLQGYEKSVKLQYQIKRNSSDTFCFEENMFYFEKAIEYYHKALSLNAGDPFCTQMLHIVLKTINRVHLIKKTEPSRIYVES